MKIRLYFVLPKLGMSPIVPTLLRIITAIYYAIGCPCAAASSCCLEAMTSRIGDPL
nr:hypothetical protein [uncultured Campylobacter sp.]